MNALGYAIVFLMTATVLVALALNFQRGMCVGLAFLMAVPDTLTIPLGLFSLTPQRIVVLLIFLFWLGQPRPETGVARSRFARLVFWFWLFQTVSMLLSVSPGDSVKGLLSFTIEGFLFYILLSRSITSAAEALLWIKSLCVGLAVAGALGFLQRYAGFDIHRATNTIVFQDSLRDINGPYSHRIMYGYGMAMGIPLFLAWLAGSETAKARRRLVVPLGLVAGSCYFAMSRGPWLGAALGTGLLAWLGTPRVRKILYIGGGLAFLLVLVRPGVWETLHQYEAQTFDENTTKGKSYEYRWTLWRVAWSKITESPERLLFGYGGLSHQEMDLSSYFERQHGGTTAQLGYTSWDNNIAADLLEYGILGVLAELYLYLRIVLALVASWRRCAPMYRDMTVAIFASSLIFLFACTNVYIYSPQLKCAFWLLIAVGTSAVWAAESQETEVGALEESLDEPGRPGGAMAGAEATWSRPI